MSLHDLFTHAGRARARRRLRRRVRFRVARRGLGLPGRPGRGPGGARETARGRRRLAAIDRALATEAPRLASMFAVFNELAVGEPVGAERLPSYTWPRLRLAYVAFLATLAAIVALCVMLSTQLHGAMRPCLAAASAPSSAPPAASSTTSSAFSPASGRATGASGLAAFTPVRALSCQAYATPNKQLAAAPDVAAPNRQAGSGRPVDRAESGVTVEDLGHEATELVSLANGEAKSLSKLAELAVRQVPGCAAAHVTIWRDGELAAAAATHPDPAELIDLEARTGPGPLAAAVHDGRPVSCRDAIDEERWPWWAAEALRRGLRSSIHLVRQSASTTLVLALFGVRPGALDADGVPMAEMLARFGSTVFANSLAYGQAQRTATQLKDSVAARAVTDQAKGILMHALGCDADEALRYLRRESQRRHVKVTEVAARVIATYAPGGRVAPAS